MAVGDCEHFSGGVHCYDRSDVATVRTPAPHCSAALRCASTRQGPGGFRGGRGAWELMRLARGRSAGLGRNSIG
jgi:hypothetical protein